MYKYSLISKEEGGNVVFPYPRKPKPKPGKPAP